MQLILTASIGFLIGFFHVGAIQDIVENAQVIAGIVQFDVLTPQLYFQKNLWSLPPQLCAIFLKLGVSETYLSFFVTGILGSLSFSAILLFLSSLKKSNDWYDFLIPFFIFSLRLFNFAPTYDIALMDTFSTSGAIGFSFSIITLSFLLLRKYSLGLVCLGLLPSVHVVWSFWIGVISLIIFVNNRQEYIGILKEKYHYLLIGLSISIISFVLFITYQSVSSPWTVENSYQLVEIFKKSWDVHRQSIELLSYFSAILIFTVVSLLLDGVSKKQTRRLLQIVTYFSITCFVAISLSSSVLENTIMVQRFFNLNILLGIVLMIYTVFSSRVISIVFLCGVTALLIRYDTFKMYENVEEIYRFNIFIFLLTVSLIALVLNYKKLIFKFEDFKKTKIIQSGVIIVTIFFSYHLELGHSLDAYDYNLGNAASYKISKKYQKISMDDGPLLTCPECRHFQYRTGRPVLLEIDTMDDLTYFPTIAHQYNILLKKLYGFSFKERPANWSESIHLPNKAVKKLWEDRSIDEWKNLAREHGFKGIITPLNWSLKLDKVNINEFNYYKVLN